MNDTQSYTPVVREDDGELLGFVRRSKENGDQWDALTVFKFPFAQASTSEDAVEIVRHRGLKVLSLRWEYLSHEDDDWHVCIILEAKQDRVVVKEGIYGHIDTRSFELTNPTIDNFRLVEQ